MPKKSNSARSFSLQLLDEVDDIIELYRTQFDRTPDVKWLQGIERCVELKLKLCVMDTKRSDESVPSESLISLCDLPLDLLQNIINHSKNLKMQKQNN